VTTLRLPRLLSDAVNTASIHELSGRSVSEVFDDLFREELGLRNHILGEDGAIRPHVSVFVDGAHANLDSPVRPDSEIRILHAVSGG
jgi:hypothetical protein